jgi:hypothetical protein
VDDDGENVVEHLAGVEDFEVALATYRAACQRWPNAAITLRQGARVIEDQPQETACLIRRLRLARNMTTARAELRQRKRIVILMQHMKEENIMKRPLIALVLAGTLAIATVATPTSAHAQWRGRGWGWGLGGFAVGALVGAALARPYYYRPAYYGYAYPAYSYGYAYPAYSYGYGGYYGGYRGYSGYYRRPYGYYGYYGSWRGPAGYY